MLQRKRIWMYDSDKSSILVFVTVLFETLESVHCSKPA